VQILSLEVASDFNVIVVLSLLATVITAVVNFMSFVTFYLGPRIVRAINGGRIIEANRHSKGGVEMSSFY